MIFRDTEFKKAVCLQFSWQRWKRLIFQAILADFEYDQPLPTKPELELIVKYTDTYLQLVRKLQANPPALPVSEVLQNISFLIPRN